MYRIFAALAASLILHMLLLANLSLPRVHASVPSGIRLSISTALKAQMDDEARAQVPDEPSVTPANLLSPVVPASPSARQAGSSLPSPLESETEGSGSTAPSATDSGESQGESGGDLGNSGSIPGEGGDGGGSISGGGTGAESAGAEASGSQTPQGPDLDAIRAEYGRLVLERISAHKVYPDVARRLGQEGEVRVGFVVASDGTASSVEVQVSSGIASLDTGACVAVEAASPFPPVPSELGVDSLALSLLIVFELD